jgi:hypothetical protein
LRDAQNERLLVLEFSVRIFCAVDLRNINAKPEAVLQMLTVGIGVLKAREPLQKLAELSPGARPHAHAGTRFNDDYRRYLLIHPLGYPSSRWKLAS